MKLKVLSILSAPSLLVIGCISEFEARLSVHDTQILVVDGTIMENTDVVFHLSEVFPMDATDVSEEIFNIEAELTIIGSNGYQSLPARKGKDTITIKGKEKIIPAYRISAGALDDNVEYGIQIKYSGDTYRSTLSKPLRTPEIDSISWVQPEKEGPISFRISTHDDESEGAMFLLWTYTEDWEVIAYHMANIFLDLVGNANPSGHPGYWCPGDSPYFYCWKKDRSRKILIGSTENLTENRLIDHQFNEHDCADERFSILYCITISQQAISKEAYEYYQQKMKFTEEMGGLFTPQPHEVKGNITCMTDPSKKVFGYVETIKNRPQQRIFVDTQKDKITRPPFLWIRSECELISHGDISKYVPDYSKNIFREFYNKGYRPVYKSPVACAPESWAVHSCTDCRENTRDGIKATKNKPDFWPNDHE